MAASFDELILLRPILHITQPGPENRNLMRRVLLSLNFWIKCSKERQKIYGDIQHTFYDITLIIDDIEDGTILRRGIPSAHMVYGISLTVRATIHEIILSFQNLLYHLEGRKDDVTDQFIRVCIEFFLGLEIYYRDIVECHTFDEYRTIALNKFTSSVLWRVRLLEHFANKKKIEFSLELFVKMGLFLQIYDDYINLHNPKYATVRVFCDDLDEGKFSFPIIHAIQSHPNDHRLLDMLKRRPLDVESKKLFVEIMESFGSFEYTRNKLEDLRKGILEDVDNMKLDKNPHLESVLQDIFSHLETEIYFDGCD